MISKAGMSWREKSALWDGERAEDENRRLRREVDRLRAALREAQWALYWMEKNHD